MKTRRIILLLLVVLPAVIFLSCGEIGFNEDYRISLENRDNEVVIHHNTTALKTIHFPVYAGAGNHVSSHLVNGYYEGGNSIYTY